MICINENTAKNVQGYSSVLIEYYDDFMNVLMHIYNGKLYSILLNAFELSCIICNHTDKVLVEFSNIAKTALKRHI